MSEIQCPECGETLSISADKNRKGQIIVTLWCEGDYSDAFECKILTALTDEDLNALNEPLERRMKVVLVRRKADPELKT